MKNKLWTLVLPLAAMLIPYAVFKWLQASPHADMALQMPEGHFYIVSAVSILALVLAIAVGVTGRRLRNMKVSFLSLAFISLAEVFAVHGLSTPGLLMDSSHLPGAAAQLSVTLTAFWMWMSSLRSDSAAVQWLARWQAWLAPAWAILLFVFGAFGLLFPRAVEWIPVDRNPVQWALALFSMLLFLIVIYQYWLTYRFSRFPLQLSIVYSAGWLLVAQIIIVQGVIWHLSWWIYHFLLLAAMLVMLVGLYRQYGAGVSIGPALSRLFHFDPVERVEAGISSSVRALVLATESRDAYTAGHNYRVAVFGMRLAEEVGLGPDELRAIAQGAIVHDVGKMQIPDAILNKPGKLTEAERAIIERHPVIGYDLCQRLGLMQEELGIIRSHHEKWNGTGYPDGLRGKAIPKLARIIAVADVYDALTSARSYRQAWKHEDAMRLIAEQAGVHFDPDFAAAWRSVCKDGAPSFRYPFWVQA